MARARKGRRAGRGGQRASSVLTTRQERHPFLEAHLPTHHPVASRLALSYPHLPNTWPSHTHSVIRPVRTRWAAALACLSLPGVNGFSISLLSTMCCGLRALSRLLHAYKPGSRGSRFVCPLSGSSVKTNRTI